MSEPQANPRPDPLLPIINILTEVQSALPMVGGFIPAPFGAIVMIGVPILEEVLTLIDKAQQGTVHQNDFAHFFDTLSAHFKTASTTLKQP